MDGFTGYKTAAEQLPDAAPVMGPFHVIGWAVMPWTGAGNGSSRKHAATAAAEATRSTKPARPLRTGTDLLTDRQRSRLEDLFAADAHGQVEATGGVYQQMIAAYRNIDPTTHGRQLMQKVIDSISHNVPTALTEVTTLERTLKRRATDILAYFDRPGTTTGASEAIIIGQTRTSPRVRARIPQPDQLHRPQSARGRRIQTPSTPSFMQGR